MGRRPNHPGAVPRLRLRKRHGKTWYYYDHGGKPRREEALGCDYAKAIAEWAKREGESPEHVPAVLTFRYVADRYRAEEVPKKAPGTQRKNHHELARLLVFFDDPPCPLAAIEAQHVHQYMRWRRGAPIAANRERALLSHIWNWARRQGYTNQPNPCRGVNGNPEHPRDVYVEDDVFAAVWNNADQPLRDALDLAYLTGQRPADVLRMRERDVREHVLHVGQGKTGAKLRIAFVDTDELGLLLARIRARKRGYVLHCTDLIVDERGRPLRRDALRYRFDKARRLAGVAKSAYQFRDLRAKAGTDTSDATDLQHAQRQLGHRSIKTTEIYIRNRRGDRVAPTKHRAPEPDCGTDAILRNSATAEKQRN